MTKSLWNGYERIDFLFENRECILVFPKTPTELFDEFKSATGMTLSELISYREHPLDKIPTIFNNNIPIVLVYGDTDDVVPYNENGMLLENYYKSKGGNILAIGKAKCGHHPHGLEDNSPIIDFITKYGV